jgi:NADH:ubiquinone oxidoreductase subunit 4 (subunit M)
LIFAFGVYPKPMLELTESVSRSVVEAVTSTISKK